MVPYARLDLFPVDVGNDAVGILDRHVAIDAVRLNLCAELRKLGTVAILVALQAFFRVRRRGAIGAVYFVARRAGHLRVLVAAASLRQRHLIAVHIDMGIGVW